MPFDTVYVPFHKNILYTLKSENCHIADKNILEKEEKRDKKNSI